MDFSKIVGDSQTILQESFGAFLFEGRAHSLPVERQMQSVLLRELRDLSFSIHFV